MGDKNPHKQPKPKKDTKKIDIVKEEIPQPELIKKIKKGAWSKRFSWHETHLKQVRQSVKEPRSVKPEWGSLYRLK